MDEPAELAAPSRYQGRADHDQPVVLGVMAAFLHTGTMIDRASSVLLIGTFLCWLQPLAGPARLAVGVALLFALFEKYYAWRVALDAHLFAVLARHPQQVENFDAALAACLGKPTPPTPPTVRSVQSRWRGARRLLICQVCLLGLQLCALLFAWLR